MKWTRFGDVYLDEYGRRAYVQFFGYTLDDYNIVVDGPNLTAIGVEGGKKYDTRDEAMRALHALCGSP